MPSTRVLKGIANGLVDTFMSRNNDVSGYWGIGQIQREVEEQSQTVIELDLLHGQVASDGPVARALVAHYSQYLETALTRDGFTFSEITKAKLIVQFGTFGKCRIPDLVTRGAPFNCEVVLARLNGKVYSAARAGCSWPHDPEREQRSVRGL